MQLINPKILESVINRSSGKLLSKERILKLKRPVFYEWMQKVNSLPSVEQRHVELNFPKLYGWHNSWINDEFITLGTEKVFKFVTRTHVEQKLPTDYYSHSVEDCNLDYKRLVDSMKQLLVHNFYLSKERHSIPSDHSVVKDSVDEERFFSDFSFMLSQELGPALDHLRSAEFQMVPVIKNFWFCNNMVETQQYRDEVEILLRNRDKKNPLSETRKTVGKYNIHPMRSTLTPSIGIRTEYPLPNVMDKSDANFREGENFKEAMSIPVISGVREDYNRAIIAPGFVPGMPCEFGFLYMYSPLTMKSFMTANDNKHLDHGLEQKLVISGFSQAAAHAFYQGATPFLDPNVPVTQQTVITNGQTWKIGLYQLNRTCMVGESNSLQNILWCTDNLKLYDVIEDGKVKGFNDEVFKTILKVVTKPTRTSRDERKVKFLKDLDFPPEFKKAFNEEIMQMMGDIRTKRPEMQSWFKIFKFQTNRYKKCLKPTPFDESATRMIHPEDVTLGMLRGARIPQCLRIKQDLKYQPCLDTENLFKFPKKRDIIFFRDQREYFETIGIKPDPLVSDPYMYRRY